MKATSIAILFLLVLAGCGGPMSEEAYGAAFKKSCEEYRDLAKRLDAKPLPDKTGLNKEQRMAALATRMQEDTMEYLKLADAYRRLKPPQSFGRVHSAYQEFLDGQVRINTEYANALAANNVEEARRKNEEFVTFLGTQMNWVLDEVGKLGSSNQALKDEIAQAVKESM